MTPALRLQHVAGAGEHQRHLLVGDDHHGFQPAQVAVGAPVLGELNRRARELAGILLELGLQPLEQGEGVGGGAGKAADHVAFAELAHLFGISLDNGLADRDLAVAADGDQSRLCGQSRSSCHARKLGRIALLNSLVGVMYILRQRAAIPPAFNRWQRAVRGRK